MSIFFLFKEFDCFCFMEKKNLGMFFKEGDKLRQKKKNLWNGDKFKGKPFLKGKQGNPSTKVQGMDLNPRPSVQIVNALPLGYILSYDIAYEEYMIRREAF